MDFFPQCFFQAFIVLPHCVSKIYLDLGSLVFPPAYQLLICFMCVCISKRDRLCVCVGVNIINIDPLKCIHTVIREELWLLWCQVSVCRGSSGSQGSRLRSWKRFASTLQHRGTHPPPIEKKTANMVCSTMKDPHTPPSTQFLLILTACLSCLCLALVQKSPMCWLFALVNWILTVIQYHVLDNENVSSYLLSEMKIILLIYNLMPSIFVFLLLLYGWGSLLDFPLRLGGCRQRGKELYLSEYKKRVMRP